MPTRAYDVRVVDRAGNVVHFQARAHNVRSIDAMVLCAWPDAMRISIRCPLQTPLAAQLGPHELRDFFMRPVPPGGNVIALRPAGFAQLLREAASAGGRVLWACLRRGLSRLWLHAQRLHLVVLLQSVTYEAVWNVEQAQHTAPDCELLRQVYMQRAGAAEKEAGRLRVEIAQVEALLWPVKR